jgi:flagellar hook-associated protein 1 FlgK
LRAELAAAAGTGVSGVFAGSEPRFGVDVTAITRLRDEVLDQQARNASGRSGLLTEHARATSLIEQRLGGLEDASLSAQLEALWNAFADLANNPGSTGPRHVVLQQAQQVALTMNQLARGSLDQRAGEVATVRSLVGEVNDLARSIGRLQAPIGAAHAAGTPSNELADQQDRMLDRLSELIGVQITRLADGRVNLHVDGHMLVSDGIVSELAVIEEADPALAGHGLNRVVVAAAGSGRDLAVGMGRVGGLLGVVNQVIPDHLSELDAVAAAVVGTTNAIHTTGQDLDGNTGLRLFEPTPAAAAKALTVAVSGDVAGNPRRLAAAAVGAGPLDDTVARQLAALGDAQDNPALAFERLVGTVAAKVASLRVQASAAESTTTRALGAREAVSGVNLDEELTNLIESQRAYEAAARLITTIDEMLDVLINRTGLVGR